ncbi:GAF and ANTAR domain-containing protein [Arthrobacter sp. CAN_A1]|uniref:GAF and ANTAR domain-containing protein n=1 Tax=Arthrobacter sp. CAN_A1 TaxID=2787717 RepID=UPI002FD60206
MVDPYGELRVVASTSEASQLVGILQLEADAGPCIECFRTGKEVAVENIDSLAGRWPVFRTAAASQGFHSVHAIPLRVRDQTVGAMGLFGRTARVLTEGESVIGQALADVATVGLLQARTLRESAEINSQLQRALHSRVVIEQAKDVISQTAGLNMNEAFVRLRGYSRSNRLSLQETACRVVDRSLTL